MKDISLQPLPLPEEAAPSAPLFKSVMEEGQQAGQFRVLWAMRGSGFFKPGAAGLHSQAAVTWGSPSPPVGEATEQGTVARTLVLELVSPRSESRLCHLQARGPHLPTKASAFMSTKIKY